MMLKSDSVNWVFLMVFLTAIFGGVNLAIANEDQCHHGFRNKLPPRDQYNQYDTLVAATMYDITYLFPDLNFTCDGILKEVTIPWYIRGRQSQDGYKFFWEQVLRGTLSIWRWSDGKLAQIRSWAFNATLNNLKKYPTTLPMDRNDTITITPGFNVSKNDFIGITLPHSTRIHQRTRVINQHLPILMVQQWRPEYTCVSENDTTLTNSCYMPQRPNALLQIEFQPDSTGSTSKSAPTQTSGGGNGSGAIAGLGVLVGILLMVVTAMLTVIVILSIILKHIKGANPVRYNAYQNEEGNNTLQLASESKESAPVNDRVIMNSLCDLVGNEDGTFEEKRNESETLAYSPCLIHPGTPTLQRSNLPTQYNPLTQEVQYQNLGKNTANCKNEAGFSYDASFGDVHTHWNPGCTRDAICDEMRARNYNEIPKQAIDIQEQIGEGEFGVVYKGQWESTTGRTQTVALKSLKSTASNDERVKLLQEAATIGQFSHPHIIKLYGVVTITEPVMAVLEFLPEGNLRDQLLTLRNRSSKGDALQLQQLANVLLMFCQEIADGMRYLSQKGFIHRDLAARNILLTADIKCKIADFGLSKDISTDYYYKSKGGRVPVRWTAPEAVLYKKYSTKSDVWSYGMVMYEIWSLGHKPFEDWDVQEIVNTFKTEYCLPPPPGCPRQVYQLMVTCWNPNAHLRPTFDEIHHTVVTMTADNSYQNLTTGNDNLRLSLVLGAPLQYGQHLHKDLQEIYME